MSRRLPESSARPWSGIGLLLLGGLVVAFALPYSSRRPSEDRATAWHTFSGLLETGTLDGEGAITLLPFLLVIAGAVVFFLLPRGSSHRRG